jgi:TonB-linked SusC/RagA family outer membrane protein
MGKKILHYCSLCKPVQLLLLLVMLQSFAFAQESIKITGKVTSTEDRGPLPGVSIKVKGTNTGTVSDPNGNYTLNARRGAVLVFSFIGYNPIEMTVGQSTTINAALSGSSSALDEVVVVSYGSSRKRDITGAVSKVAAEDLQNLPAAEIGQKLTGRVAGLQVNQSTGRPGQGMSFRIRGAASLGSSNQPLIVVDGQPIANDGVNLLNPDDIESFSVLKDAASASLYGSRAANGVILITTKQAKVGRTTVNFNAYYGSQKVTQRGRPEIMNANEFATFMKGYYEDKIKYEKWVDPVTKLAEIPLDYRNPEQYGAGTDWYNELLRTAPMSNYSLNISTGTDKILSSNTLTYFTQDGVLTNTGMQRFSFRSNNEYTLSSKVKFGFNVSPTYQIDKNTRGNLDGNRQILVGGEISSPLIPARNPDGSYPNRTGSYGMFALPNFLQQLMILNVKQNNLRILGNAFGEIELLKGLRFRSSINTDIAAIEYNSFNSSLFGNAGSPGPTIPSALHRSNTYVSWLTENTLNYKYKTGDHNFDVLAGYTAQKYNNNNRQINGSVFPNDVVPWIVAASTTTGFTNNNAWDIASALGRLNYDYKGKYLLSATIRRDGSSRFGRNTKYGTFPSVSAAWVASDESFFPKSDNFSFFKVRVGYGETGNHITGDYVQISTLGATNYVFNGALAQGLSITTLGNPEISWETSKQSNIGLEMSFLKNRISVTYDYYNKVTSGMLYQINLPYESGYGNLRANVGEFNMWGHELQINTTNLDGQVKWNSGLTLSFNDNKVVKLNDGIPLGGTATYNDYNRTAEGRRIGELWGYVFDGVYMNQAEFDSQPKHSTSAVGTARMKDINGDGKIDANDKTYLGNPNPKYQFGLTNDVRYKNFDFSIAVSGQAGNKIMNTNLQNFQNLDGIFNIEKAMADRWRSPENPGNGKVPRTLSNTTELYRFGNSNWVFSGDYLAIRNITAGYTFDVKQKYFKTARIYASVNQAYVFTKYPGQNPEANDVRDDQNRAGQDNGSFPVPRTITIGTNINF